MKHSLLLCGLCLLLSSQALAQANITLCHDNLPHSSATKAFAVLATDDFFAGEHPEPDQAIFLGMILIYA